MRSHAAYSKVCQTKRQIQNHYTTPQASTQKSILVQYLARFECNDWFIYNPDGSASGEASYPIAALVNHSCCPNVSFGNNERTMVVRALRDIEVGEELLVTYVGDRIGSTRERKDELMDRFYFECQCARCAPPTLLAPRQYGGYPYIDNLLTKSEKPISIEKAQQVLSEALNTPYHISKLNGINLFRIPHIPSRPHTVSTL
ncbi:hypothetical protein SeMB42_g03262 [Synchytrium endobioticum]|uniref:SET domain-containing protein n=1 Tax=Synchytrium endobioticum TaxID=286115 RepID=A0A507D8E5_9FUNG|nr:hypothetical protein SeMB42_g03262 [Synchytrium endobioticum]